MTSFETAKRRGVVGVGVAMLTLVTLICVAPAAEAKAARNVVVISDADVFASAATDQAIEVKSGSALSFVQGWAAADSHLASNLAALTMTVLVDGKPIGRTGSLTEDLGVICAPECADADGFVVSYGSHPLSANRFHTLSFRWTMTGAGSDGLGSSWGAEGLAITVDTRIFVRPGR